MVKKKRRLTWLMPVLILLCLAGGAWYYFSGDDYEDLIPQRPADEDLLIAESRLNILVIGTDTRENKQDAGRADAILVGSLDLVNKKLALLSIPRDTLVEVPGHGTDKINHSFNLGGIDLTRQTVQEFLNVPIDYYAVSNFDSFPEIVDILGGVEIDVDKRMYFRTYDGLINIEKGLQRLDGDKALQYVRYRYDQMGDITRAGRQQNFLIALFKEVMAAENITKLPQLIPKVLDVVETDFSLTQMVRLAKLLNEMDLAGIQSASVPGDFATIGGISYWRPHPEETAALVEEFFTSPPEEEQPEDEEAAQ